MLSLYPINTKHFSKLTIAYILIYLTFIAFVIGLNHNFWTDEGHFYRTILLFITSPTLDTLTHYGEMSTPLPFILYAIWGKIFGSEISHLRILSLIISFSTLYAIYFLFSISFPDRKILGFWSVIAFSFIPYIPGLSFFVYTDMPAILFMILGWICLIRNKPILLFIFSSASLWCRQYMVFYIVAGLAFLFIHILNDTKRKKNIKLAIGLFLSICSLLPLIWIWGGLSPDNEIKNQYIIESTRFNFHALNTYLYTIALFSFPVLITVLPYLLRNFRLIILSFFVSLFYWAYPIQTSEASMKLGYFHVGFFHKFLSKIFLYDWHSGLIFQILIFCSLLFLFSGISHLFQEFRTKNRSFHSMEIFSILAFLLVMPFSYLTWEKYAIPVIPFVYMSVFRSLAFEKFWQFTKSTFIKKDH